MALDDALEDTKDEPKNDDVSDTYLKPSLFNKLKARIYKRALQKRIDSYNDVYATDLVGRTIRNAFPATSKRLHELKEKIGEISQDEVAETFYSVVNFYLRPNSTSVQETSIPRPGYAIDSLRYLNKKQLKKSIMPALGKMLNFYIPAAADRSSINKGYGHNLPYDTKINLSREEMYGLVVSALINYSDKINKIEINDWGFYDYFGAFLRNGKKLIVTPRTGNHFGFMREEGSLIKTRELTDLKKPKTLSRIIYDQARDTTSYFVKRLVAASVAIICGSMAYPALVSENLLPPIPGSIIKLLGGNPGLGFYTNYYSALPEVAGNVSLFIMGFGGIIALCVIAKDSAHQYRYEKELIRKKKM